MSGKEIARYIDHTALKPQTTEKEIIQLCKEAKEYNFAAVCVNPCYVNLAAKLLIGTKVKVATVIGFPLGAETSQAKAFAARDALQNGAHEIDMVINLGALKTGRLDIVKEDIQMVVKGCQKEDAKGLVKVIIETCLLSKAEKETACRLALEAGADFVKTSTGFAGGGATVEDVKLMKEIVGQNAGVKASGGIRDLQKTLLLIEAGADRIGTSSGVAIVSGSEENGGNNE